MEEKILKLHGQALKLLSLKQPLLWDVQKFLGLSNFATFVVPWAHLRLRALLQVLS